MIHFEQVTKRYTDGAEVLNNVNFNVEKGEFIFITGPSGAGKTTLLKLIACLERPSSGTIRVNGTQLNQLSKHEIGSYRSNLGITFQSPTLLTDRSIFDNVALPLHIKGVAHQTLTKRVYAALDMVGLLAKEKMLPQYLSQGEQQRVGIARAVVHKPSLLLADEPTGNLDPSLAAEIMRLFEQFNQVGVSVLITTHDISLIARMKHRILVLRKGQIC